MQKSKQNRNVEAKNRESNRTVIIAINREFDQSLHDYWESGYEQSILDSPTAIICTLFLIMKVSFHSPIFSEHCLYLGDNNMLLSFFCLAALSRLEPVDVLSVVPLSP